MILRRFAFPLASLLAACTAAPQWEKPGMTDDSLALDLKQCQLSAPIAPRPPPGPRKSPGSLIDFDTMAEREGDRMLKDQRHVGECMRAKGYSDAAR